MKLLRIGLLSLFLSTFASAAAAAPSVENYPDRVIRMVVAYPPGGAADLIGRMLAEELSKTIGQTVIVENKPGATGAIGSESVARANPDGYTLLLAISDSHSVNPAVSNKVPYDPVKDFVPISLIALQPLMLAAGPKMESRSIAEFVATAKAKPNSVTIASNGAGGLNHMAIESFSSAAGIKIVHVPYKGVAPAIADTIGGHVDAIVCSLQSAGGNVSLRGGKLRPLVISGSKRLGIAPTIPTFAESGYPQFLVSQWYGLLAPKGTPPEIIDKLNQQVNAALKTDIGAKLRAEGTEPVGSTPGEFQRFLAAELARWVEVAKANKIRVE